MTEPLAENETGRGEAAGPQRGSLVGAKAATGADVAAKAGTVEPSLSRRGEIALSYARRGFKVFPIAEGTKADQRLATWTAASDEEATVRRWWLKWPNDNIGIACGLSGLCVLDLDQKKGKDGRGELDELELNHGQLPNTLHAKTPNGGWHLYFRGTTGQRPIGKGIDVRSTGGYVVAPGSSIEEGKYAWCNDEPIAELPSWLEGLIGAPRERKDRDQAPAVELDNEAAIVWAEHYLLRDAPPAIEHQRGNETTYKVAARLHGVGLSEPKALDMMLEHYNPRCEPPWAVEDLQKWVANGFRYAQNQAGSESAEADFANEPLPFVDSPSQEPLTVSPGNRFLKLDQLLGLPRPQWLVHGLLPLEAVGTLYGPSGSLKSFLAFHLAACCAVEREAFPGRPCKSADSFYIAAEGGYGFSLRAAAWIKHHTERPERLHLLPGSVFLDRDGEAAKLAKEINSLSSPDARKLIVVDTLSANFTGKENTDDVADFFRRCSELGRKCRATVLIIHHTGKDPDKEERGHYSIRANADFSIRMDGDPKKGVKVKVRKLKDADPGLPLCLSAKKVEVAAGEEFSSSLVLVEKLPAARDFDQTERRDEEMLEILIEHDGGTLKSAAEELARRFDINPNTAKNWIKGMRDPRVRLERADRSNRQSGLIVRVREQ